MEPSILLSKKIFRLFVGIEKMELIMGTDVPENTHQKTSHFYPPFLLCVRILPQKLSPCPDSKDFFESAWPFCPAERFCDSFSAFFFTVLQACGILFVTGGVLMDLENYSNRARPFFIRELLHEYSDEEHELTTNEIVGLLDARYGIQTQRTRIASDVRLLDAIEDQKDRAKDPDSTGKARVEFLSDSDPGRQTRYRMLGRRFEPVEIKLLIDAVHSSLFLSEQKSEELTGKLLGLLSRYQADEVRSTVVDNEMLKPGNEKIMYIVDALMRAILLKRPVSFPYFRYDLMKRQVARNDSHSYVVSPYALVWNSDHYYLIAFSEKHQAISHFRVDRISETPVTLDAAFVPLPEGFDLARYKSTMFRMYSSRRAVVELACDESVMDSIVDRFGRDVDTGLIDDRTFSVTAEVAVNHIFFSWIFGFAGKVKILGPADVLDEYAEMLLASARHLTEPFEL